MINIQDNNSNIPPLMSKPISVILTAHYNNENNLKLKHQNARNNLTVVYSYLILTNNGIQIPLETVSTILRIKGWSSLSSKYDPK